MHEQLATGCGYSKHYVPALVCRVVVAAHDGVEVACIHWFPTTEHAECRQMLDCSHVRHLSLCSDPQIWDLGGQQNLRPFWATYYKKCDAVIMVVDSTDRARVSITKVGALGVSLGCLSTQAHKPNGVDDGVCVPA